MQNGIYVLFLFEFILETEFYEVKVQVGQGTLIGKTLTTILDKRSYHAFYGVPYAQPPIQKLRFKDPVAPKTWNRPYDASVEYHGACAQAHIIHKHGVYGLEDCLYLNIYAPTRNKKINSKLPVIVWVHGYAFTSSFSHIHGGDFFIENNVIFITLTHRIGAFGFLSTRETNTNMGLKDIILALKWIKQNIKQFGGDRNKVTVIGSGSGGTFLSLLLITDSHKLFSKIILQSASMFDAATFRNNPMLEKKRLLDNLREKGILNLKTASTRDIIAASHKIYNNHELMNNQRPMIPFMPIVESNRNKSIFTKMPKEYFENINHIQKPILIGFNSQESIAEVIPFLHNPEFLKSFEDHFKYMVPFSDGCKYNISTGMYKTVADLIKLKYFQSGVSHETFLKYTSDLYKYPVIRFVKSLLNVKANNIFMYKFSYSGKFNIFKTTSTIGAVKKIKGASHGDEICYLVKCEPLSENYLKAHSDINDPDTRFIKQIVNMWANFAKLGNPTTITGIENFTWPQITIKDENMMLLDRETKIINTKLENSIFSFWNMIYEKYYSLKHCSYKKHEEL